MANVKLVMAQLEGDEATVLEAIRSFAAPVLVGVPVALPAIAAAVAPVVERPVKVRAPKTAIACGPKEMAEPADGSSKQRVIAALQKRGMSSGELIKAMPDLTSPMIYTALTALRKEGRVRTVEKPDAVGRVNEFVR